jgi:UDP-N-acetylmuramyl pentapeptide synthase
VLTFGLSPEHDVWADEIELDWPIGTTFRLHLGGQTHRARVRLLGSHQVRAAVAAAVVAWVEGLDVEGALQRLAALEPSRGRLEAVPLSNGAIVLADDFKAPVETIDAALDLLAKVPARRKVVVLGMIAEAPQGATHALYRRLGVRVADIADRLISFGGWSDYGVGARKAGLPGDAITHVKSDLGQIARLLKAELGPGDVVLVKGRGSQRMERITLALQGRTVGCGLDECRVAAKWRCERCPVLEQGWGDKRVLP